MTQKIDLQWHKNYLGINLTKEKEDLCTENYKNTTKRI